MTVLVHFSGPSYSKTAVLQPGAAPIDVGRDPQAGVYLPDTDRLISRRHLTLEWADGGARVTVLSKVNGITTPRGEFSAGQSVVLAPGESAQLGRFAFAVEAGAGAAAAAAPIQRAAPAADDPFQIFGSAGAAAPGGSSMFDDPFFRAAKPAQAPAMEMPAALDALSGNQPALNAPFGFSGAPVGGSGDPLAGFGGNQPPVHSSVSIDEFLGSPGRQTVGLGAANLLRPEAPESNRRLATDHVHDFNLPMRPITAPAAMPPPAPAMPFAVPPAMPAPAAFDPLAALDAFAAPPQAPALAPALPTPFAPPAPGGGNDDPWSDFAKGWTPPAAAPSPAFAAPAPAIPAAAAFAVPPAAPTAPAFAEPPANRKPPAFSAPINRAFDDAFSSSTAWRVEDMPVMDPMASASFQVESVVGRHFAIPNQPAAVAPASAAAPAPAAAGGSGDHEAALRALCRGLGVSGPPNLSDRDWEQLGQSIRQIVQGLSDLMNVRAELKKEMRAADRTMLGAQENNPLKSGMGINDLLTYLLFTPQGMAGYMPVQKALDESITDLRAHEFASLAAVRSVVEGSIKEFDPEKLRATLMKGKRSIAAVVDNARMWDLYTTHYQQRGAHMADWLEQMFNRHFMPAYSREADKLRREALPPPPAAAPLANNDPLRGF